MPRSTKQTPPSDVIEGEVIEPRKAQAEPQRKEEPKRQPAQQQPADDAPKVSVNMLTILRKKATANEIAEADIAAHFKVATLEDLPASLINTAMKVAGGAQ
jgi:hypothetical protein